MITRKHINMIREAKNKIMPEAKGFIFGSSLKSNHFRDVDIGLMNLKNKTQILKLQELLENSTFPYIIDIVDFEEVEKSFAEKIFNEKILWI